MDISAVISSLQERRLTHTAPQGHRVAILEATFIRLVSETEALRFGSPGQPEWPETYLAAANPEQTLIVQDPSHAWPICGHRFLEERVTTEGFDGLAWYRPFHWEPVDRWGIYMLQSALDNIGGVLHPTADWRSRWWSWRRSSAAWGWCAIMVQQS